MTPADLRNLITTAFREVTLGQGISIRQGEICDNYGKDKNGREVSPAKFASIPLAEITDDWTALPLAELELYPYLPYLDALGYRYYIPAFLLSLLENSQSGSMRVIATLSSVCPTRELWRHHMSQYELLDDAQRSAIATFLYHFMDNPQLDQGDQNHILNALQDYWRQYLPHPME
jgi:hypothetical protein